MVNVSNSASVQMAVSGVVSAAGLRLKNIEASSG